MTLSISTKDAAREILKARGDQPVLPLPQPPASPRKAQVEPTAPGEPEPKPNDPISQQILDRMAKAYADCTSYRDSGVVTTRFVRESGNGAVLTNTGEKLFMTAFARPDRFRFEYKDMKCNPPSRYLIWSQGTEVQTWWDIKPGIEKPASLRMAVGAANGVSGSSALTIPALLLPADVGGGKLSFITDATPAEDDTLDAVECFRLAGRYAHNPIEVWIDKKSYLVRRIDERMKFDDFCTEQTTTYDPTIDEKIAYKLLEFDPPVEN